MSKNYFKYLIKAHYKTLLLILVILAAIHPLSLFVNDIRPLQINSNIGPLELYSSMTVRLATVATITAILGILIPPFLFKGFYQKSILDNVMTIPIKKIKLITTTFVFGLIAVISLISVTYFLGILILLVKGLRFHFGIVLLYWLVLLGFAFIFYAFSSLATALSSNMVENFIMQVIILTIIPLALSAFARVFQSYNIDSFSLFAPVSINNFTVFFMPRIIKHGNGIDELLATGELSVPYRIMYSDLHPDEIYCGGTLLLMALLFAPLSVYLLYRKQAENAGHPSREIYSFKVLLPVYTAIILVLTQGSFSLISFLYFPTIMIYVFTVIIYYVTLFVLNRGIKAYKWDHIALIIVLGSAFFLSIIQSLIAH